MYADDACAIISGKNIREMESQSHAALADLNKRFTSNKLHLNADETKLVIYHTIQATVLFDFLIFSQNNKMD